VDSHIAELVERLRPVLEAEDRALRLDLLHETAWTDYTDGSGVPSSAAESGRLDDTSPKAMEKAKELREAHADELASLAYWIRQREQLAAPAGDDVRDPLT
jgi:hypothetical protein